MSAQFFLFDLSSLLNPKPKLTFKKNNLNQSVMHIQNLRKDNGESLLKAQNRFTICTDVQSKLVAKVCSLFVNLLMAMLLTGSFSVKSALYDMDSFSRK